MRQIQAAGFLVAPAVACSYLPLGLELLAHFSASTRRMLNHNVRYRTDQAKKDEKRYAAEVKAVEEAEELDEDLFDSDEEEEKPKKRKAAPKKKPAAKKAKKGGGLCVRYLRSKMQDGFHAHCN